MRERQVAEVESYSETSSERQCSLNLFGDKVLMKRTSKSGRLGSYLPQVIL